MAAVKIHPLCAALPDITGPAWEAFKKAVEDSSEPVWRWTNQILDGKNLYRAREELGATHVWREWHPPGNCRDEQSQLAAAEKFVASRNLEGRRHLSQSDRSMFGAKLAGLAKGRPKLNTSLEVFSQDEAAEKAGVSLASIQRATEVNNNAIPAVIKAVQAGDVKVTDAAAIAREPAKVQARAVKAVKSGKAKTLRAAVKPSVKGFDDSAVIKAIDVLVRLFDKRANALNCKQSRGHKACVTGLANVLKEFKAWQKVR